MELREKIFRENEFFQNKQDLVEQILHLEKQRNIFLPNSFEKRIRNNYLLGNKKLEIGRLHSLYYLAIETEEGSETYRHQLFENKSKFRDFFIKLAEALKQREMEKKEEENKEEQNSHDVLALEQEDIAYWFSQIEKLN